MKATKVSAADLELFHQATRLVKPMAGHKRHDAVLPKKVSDPKLQAKRINAEGLNTHGSHLNFGDIIDTNAAVFFDESITEYVQIGYGTDLIRDLKRGKWQAQANLDLHGYTMEDALVNLDRFISACLDNNIRCVRIIHGKGMGSPSGKAILKTAIRHHLGRLKSVQAWIQAKERDGGAGAVLALLKHKK